MKNPANEDMRFKQGVPTLELSIERGTSAVPADGKYHVTLRGQIIFSSRSQKKALAFYRTEREKLFEVHGRPEPPQLDREQWLREERVSGDIRAMHSEWLHAYGPKIGRKGGKGGRGGV